MIKQEFFKAPPRKEQTYSPTVWTPLKDRVWNHLSLTWEDKPDTPAPASLKLQEKVCLQVGDSLDTSSISPQHKQNIFMFARAQAVRMNLHTYKWVYKRTIPFEQLPFAELFLTQGIKEREEECHFAQDAAGAMICFNIKAFRVGDFIRAFNNQEPQSFSVLDPFSISVIPTEVVKKHFNASPMFQQFMGLQGFKAC